MRRSPAATALCLAACSGDVAGPSGADADPGAVRLAWVRDVSHLVVAGDYAYVRCGPDYWFYRIPRAGGVPERVDEASEIWPVSSGAWTWHGRDGGRLRYTPAKGQPLDVPGWVANAGTFEDVACFVWSSEGDLHGLRAEVRRSADPAHPEDLGIVPALAWIEALPDGRCVARTIPGEILLLGRGGHQPVAAPESGAPLRLVGRDGPTLVWRAGDATLALSVETLELRPVPGPPTGFDAVLRADGWDYGFTGLKYEYPLFLPHQTGTHEAWGTLWRGRPGTPDANEAVVSHPLPEEATADTPTAFDEIDVEAGFVYFTTEDGYVARKALPP
jgi:hypothetical protein